MDFSVFEPLLLFSVFFLPGYLLQGQADFDPAMFNDLWFNVSYIITALPQIFLVLYIINLKPGRTLSDFGIAALTGKDILWAFPVLAGIYLCILPAGVITLGLFPETDNSMIYGTGWYFSRPGLIPLILVSCIVTGYSEELFFRAYLSGFFGSRGMKSISVALASSLLFGAGHVYEGLYAFAATSLIGLFLFFVFTRRKSLHTVAIGHGLYNFSILLLSLTEAS